MRTSPRAISDCTPAGILACPLFGPVAHRRSQKPSWIDAAEPRRSLNSRRINLRSFAVKTGDSALMITPPPECVDLVAMRGGVLSFSSGILRQRPAQLDDLDKQAGVPAALRECPCILGHRDQRPKPGVGEEDPRQP